MRNKLITFGRLLDCRIGGAVILGWFSVKSSSSNSSLVLRRLDCCSLLYDGPFRCIAGRECSSAGSCCKGLFGGNLLAF